MHICTSGTERVKAFTTIFQVLTESEQMRKEADDTGPMAELEHWRQLTARFNSILQQIKGHDCKMVINILHIAKSKVLKVGILLNILL